MMRILEWAAANGPALIFEADPKTLALTYVSPNARRILGYAPSELLGTSAFWTERVHPDDRDRLIGELRSKGESACRLQRRDGRYLRARAVLRPRGEVDGSPAVLFGYVVEIGGGEPAGPEARHEEELLRAVDFAAGCLLRAPSWEDSIDQILARMVEAAGVTRAYLFRYVRSGDGSEVGELHHEFVSPHAPQVPKGPPEDEEEWRETLRSGTAIQGPVDELTEPERRDLAARGVQSAAIIPVLVDGELWGHLGFEDHARKRRWSPTEVQALTGAAEVLGTAVSRELSETRYRSLVETVPAALYVEALGDSFAPDYPWASDYVSPQVEAITGYPAEVWKHPQKWPAVLHPDDRDAVVEEDVISNRADPRDVPPVTEYRVVKPDGSIGWVHDEATMVRDKAGRPLFWQGFMLDLTEQKRAEQRLREAEAKFRTLVERLPATVFIEPLEADQDLYVSPHVETLLGYTQGEWLASSDAWLRHVHPDDRDWVRRKSARSTETGEPFSAEYRMLTKDGRTIWVREENAPVRDDEGNPRFWQGIWLDISESKRAEEAVREALRRERQVAERLRAVDEMKSTFLNAISHELRTPLTSILGFATVLEQQTDDLSSGRAREFVSRLTKNARKLTGLLEDLLDLNRLTQGVLRARRTPTEVPDLVRRVIQDMEIHDRPVHLDLEPIRAELDAPKVERVVENLLANAIKYTPAGSPLWVRARWEGGGVLLAVEDAGPGVPDNLKEAVFGAFQHGPASATQAHSPGTGVGLSLVAQIARMHGGCAWVEDRPGGGASFRVLLPAPSDPEETGRMTLARRDTGEMELRGEISPEPRSQTG